MVNSCNVCNKEFEECEIMILNCGHRFNWTCMEAYLQQHLTGTQRCPVNECNTLIMDSEIRLVIDHVLNADDIDEYERTYLKKQPENVATANITKVSDSSLIPNPGIFQCDMCCREIGKGRGIQLINCFDNICKECLCEHVKSSEKIPVACPFLSCKAIIDDRECREILSKEDKIFYERKSLNQAVSRGNNTKTDRCRKHDCPYLVDINIKLKSWKCPTCSSLNCVNCDAIHQNQSCSKYKATLAEDNDKKDIEKKIKQKELMRCPDCRQLIKKVDGCSWFVCPGCNVELCWITKQRCWGPKGRGDTSGGCRSVRCQCYLHGVPPDFQTFTPSILSNYIQPQVEPDNSFCVVM